MKIAISGAQGVGKSTLIEVLKKEQFFKDFNFTNSTTRIAKNKGLQINESGNDETQKEIARLHINNLKIEGDCIYDRCLLDCLVYTRFLFLEGNIKEETLKFIETNFLKYFAHYDLICYIEPEFELKNDNTRSTSIYFRNAIQFIFDYYIKKYNLRLLKLSGSVEERAKQLKDESKYFNLRVDIHQHLGYIHKSSNYSKSKGLFVSVEQSAENIINQKLTDVVILYSDYEFLEQLQKLCPNVRLYGLQYVNNFNIKLDLKKSLFKGLKLHNSRAEIKYDYKYEILSPLFNQLPENSLILYHTQQRTILNKNNLEEIQTLAVKYPKLKHILGHSGAYGVDIFLIKDKNNTNYNYVRKLFSNAKSDFFYSTILANNYPNIFCDTAIYAIEKAKQLSNTLKFGIGTDFNFGNKDIYNFDKQINQFVKYTGVSKHIINRNSYIFLNETIEDAKLLFNNLEKRIYDAKSK